MKRKIAIILSLVFLCKSVVSAEEILDFSEYTTEQLIELQKTIRIELDNRIIEKNSVPLENEYLYLSNGIESKINVYTGKGGEIVIPDLLENVPVTRIGESAFENVAEAITGIRFPQSLIEIGENALYGAKNLTGILEIPDEVSLIDSEAFRSAGYSEIIIQSDCEIGILTFANMNNLECLYIKEGSSPNLQDWSFLGNDSLLYVIIPNSVTQIADSAFESCIYMKIITPEGSYAEEYARRNFIACETESYNDYVKYYEEMYLEKIEEKESESEAQLAENLIAQQDETQTVERETVLLTEDSEAENEMSSDEIIEAAQKEYETAVEEAAEIATDIVDAIQELIEQDLGRTVEISEMYFNDKKQKAIIYFEVEGKSDIAMINFENEEIGYESVVLSMTDPFDVFNYAYDLGEMSTVLETSFKRCGYTLIYAEDSLIIEENMGKIENIDNISDSDNELYLMGMYKVGTDIPAGEYMLFSSKESGYFAVSSDSNQNDIIFNDNFNYNSIITINDGEYLELVRAYAVPINDVPIEDISVTGEGMFKVGKHIPAGEYKLIADDSKNGYYAIYASSRQGKIISNNLFENSNYVTLSDDQYIQLVRCTFEEVQKMELTDEMKADLAVKYIDTKTDGEWDYFSECGKIPLPSSCLNGLVACEEDFGSSMYVYLLNSNEITMDDITDTYTMILMMDCGLHIEEIELGMLSISDEDGVVGYFGYGNDPSIGGEFLVVAF